MNGAHTTLGDGGLTSTGDVRAKRRIRVMCEIMSAVRRTRIHERSVRVAIGKTSSCHVSVNTAMAPGQDPPVCEVSTILVVIVAVPCSVMMLTRILGDEHYHPEVLPWLRTSLHGLP